MNQRILLHLMLLGTSLIAKGQDVLRSVEPAPLTFSSGAYPEHHAKDSMIRIGMNVYNTVTGRAYRMGCEGQKNHDALHGAAGTHRLCDQELQAPRVGRFLSLDPLAAKYPHNSPYAFSENRVIDAIELEGLEKYLLTARAFIPQAQVSNPSPFSKSDYFKGDNRTSYLLNTLAYRTEQKVSLDFYLKTVSTLSNVARASHGLDMDGNVVESSEPDVAGPNPTYDAPALQNGNSTTVHLQVDAPNKLASGAPAINYDLNVSITHNEDGTFNYNVTGSSDGFPAYELWITDETNGQSFLLWNRNPIESNEGPMSLFPPMEHNYSFSGNSGALTPITTAPFGETRNSCEDGEDCD